MAAFPLPDHVEWDDLAPLRAAGDRYIDQVDEPVFDLAGVQSANSATVAALVAWFRYAHSHGKVVRFVHVPKGIMNIIEVTELNEVLPLESSGE